MIGSRFIKTYILAPLYSLPFATQSLFLPDSLDSLEYERAYDLYIPTYERSGQAVHPDIIRNAPDAPAFVMAYTPYPFSIDTYENPSIVVSDDGLRFRFEKKGINPLAPTPFKDHNDDPDIFLDGATWNIAYLETLRPEAQNIRLLQSTDRIHWTNTVLKSTDLRSDKNPFVLSPAFVRLGDDFLMYYVNKKQTGYRIEYVLLKGGISGSFGAWTPADIDLTGLCPWHVDIIASDGRYYMLISCVSTDTAGENSYALYIARSDDLISWQLSPKRVLANSYRATAFISSDDMYVYYSRQKGFLSPWRIGVYRTKLSGFFGAS